MEYFDLMGVANYPDRIIYFIW